MVGRIVISIWKTFGSCLSSLLLLYECMYYVFVRTFVCDARSLFFFLYVCRRRIKNSKEVGKLAMRIDDDPVMRV